MQPVSNLSDSGFVPRKEFIRDQRTTSHFSLLAISGSSFIRLYSFSLEVIADLRRLFDHFYLNAACREDTTQKLCEFQLHGKPWASPKSARTERILLDILAVIYRHSYTILSTIDYGRERDDRLAISFSRLSASPLPISPHSPIPAGSGSNLSHGTGGKHERKMPFAISFVSSTLMRVIYPPLNSTPAILQAVRGSWPRGVVSEKKVGDAAYEFKLKGYSWFNEDTFATDSLHQILSLLTSLDSHACMMVASLSICGRSRVKDLWLFLGPGSPDAYDQNWPESPISRSGSMLDIRRSNRASTPDPGYSSDAGVIPASLHKRVATTPQYLLSPSQGPPSPHHIRTATEPNGFSTSFPVPLSLSSPHAVPGISTRKPAPRAQVPVSVDFDAHDDDEHGRYRTSLPSAVPSSCENMTGIGTLNRNKFNSKAAYPSDFGGPPVLKRDDEETTQTSPEQYVSNGSRSPSPRRRISALRPVSTRSKTPPLLTSHARDPRTPSPPPSISLPRTQDFILGENSTLLSPGTFRIRDSAFSSNSVDTTGTRDVPTRWTELGKPEGIENIEEEQELFTEEPRPHPVLHTPVLPGSWSMTVEDESSGTNDSSRTDEATVRPEHGRHPDRSLHDVDARVVSPEFVHDDGAVRKSEAGMIGMIGPRIPPLPIPTPSSDSLGKSKGNSSAPASPTKTGSRSGSGNGWVLVNVEGKDHANGHLPSPLASPTIPNQDRSRKVSHVNEKAPMPTATKAIVVIDARDSKSARVRGGGSGLRRLLSISRPSKGAEELTNDARLVQTRSHELATNGTSQSRELARPGRLRNKLARLGAPESSIKPPDNGRVRVNLN